MLTGDYLKDLDLFGVKKFTNQPSVILSSIKRHSASNTLSIAAVSAWLQFSLAYVAAIIITSNDLSFITAIFNPTLMSAYALVSVILGAVLLTSLALKYMNRKEIEESSIDDAIRDGKFKEAEKIEVITNLGSKGMKFSIIIPISKTQGEILDGQIEENRNKVISLTIPYVISVAVIIGALVQNRFSFANVVGWEEWVFIALVSTIAIVGICIAFNKLRNNEKNEKYKFVKKFDNLDIILPWRKGSIVSVMEKKGRDQEENPILSRLIQVLREIGDKLCEIADKRLQGVENNFNVNINNFFKEIEGHSKILLDHLEKILEQNVGEVSKTSKKAIIKCLQGIADSVGELCEETSEDVKDKLGKVNVEEIMDLVNTLKGKASKVNVEKIMDLVNNVSELVNTLEDRIARVQLGSNSFGIPQVTLTNHRIPNLPAENEIGDNQTLQDGNEFIGMLRACNKRVNELKKQLEEIKNKQDQSNYASGTNEGKQLKKEVRKSERELERLKKECEEVQKKQSLPNSHTKEITTLSIKIKKIEELLKEVQNKQNQSDNGYNSSASEDEDNTTDPLETQVKAQRKEVRRLRLEKESNELAEQQAILEKELKELPKQKEWKEKINGPASEFFYSELKDIKLEIVDSEGKKDEKTLLEIGATVGAHFGNGEQKICPIEGKGGYKIPPGSVINFLDPNIQVAWKKARG